MILFGKKEEAALAGSFKNRTYFRVTEIVFFVIFPHFFAPVKARFHQRTFIYIQDAGFFAGKKRTGIFTCS